MEFYQRLKNKFMEQINIDKNIKIEFTPQQLSIVIAILKKGIFEQVTDVMATIQRQIIEQVKPEQ